MQKKSPIHLNSSLMVVLTIALIMSGCASNDVSHTAKAAIMPLNDLNLVKDDIPTVLLSAQAKPYAMPEDAQCERLQAYIRDLDNVLGPDLDAPASDEHPSLIERGTNEAKESMIKAIGRTTESAVPFRSWVRKLSGAERHSRQTLAAITAGTVRRGFLKGLYAANRCI
jgi:hypothetical protein